MRRFAPHLIFGTLGLCLLALNMHFYRAPLSLLSTALAQLPTSCQFPAQLDQFESVAPGTHWTAVMHNQLLCAINELETYVLNLQAGGQAKCLAVSLAAAERKRITVSLDHPVTGSEAVFISAREADSAWLDASGIEEVSGSAVVLWVFNHDAQATRTGIACVHVVTS